jgi:hypothetical protein
MFYIPAFLEKFFQFIGDSTTASITLDEQNISNPSYFVYS